MSASRTRFLLMMGALSLVLAASTPARAERRALAWQGAPLGQLNASREALGPGSSRTWGAPFSPDEAYAGPWAYSPLAAPPRGPARAAAPFERAPASSPSGGGSPSADAARSADALLSRLGPIGLLASIVVPAAAVVSSGASGASRGTSKGVTARVGVAKMAGGYGIVVAGRF
ncbi:MAG TPA: hypothetical protein VFS43_47485 [Polyangiaceae bacterium]|nr:hypothetical protein [Polyangiaceae bacterium]